MQLPVIWSAFEAPFPYFLVLLPTPARLEASELATVMTFAVELIAGVMLVIIVVWDKTHFRFRSCRNCSYCCRPSRDCKCTAGRRRSLRCYTWAANCVWLSCCVVILFFLLLISSMTMPKAARLGASHPSFVVKVFWEFSSFEWPSSLSFALLQTFEYFRWISFVLRLMSIIMSFSDLLAYFLHLFKSRLSLVNRHHHDSL